MSENWTQGPWFSNQEFGVVDAPVKKAMNVVDCTNARIVGKLFTARLHQHEISANTHLCAAAPELYDALQLARETIASFPKSMGYDITHLATIDAALRKARGETDE